MFRFNLSSIIPSIAVLALAVSCLSGCGAEDAELASQTASPRDYLVVDGELKYIQEGDTNKWYVSCPDGVSSRLMVKWLRVEHDISDPDVCLPFNDVVDMVKRELPRLHAEIDNTNHVFAEEWSAFKKEVQDITDNAPNVAAPMLFDVLCNGKEMESKITHPNLQWTLFRSAHPLEVWLAVKRIQRLDEYGYETKIDEVKGHDGEVEYRDDEWYYQVAMDHGPFVGGGGVYPHYGEVGGANTLYVVESSYESMRALSDNYKLPTTIYDGPYCDF